VAERDDPRLALEAELSALLAAALEQEVRLAAALDAAVAQQERRRAAAAPS
jgi:hypothetical protein